MSMPTLSQPSASCMGAMSSSARSVPSYARAKEVVPLLAGAGAGAGAGAAAEDARE
jgi:hypothetical protein